MGQRDGFSSMDIEKVNRMYKCKDNPKPEEPPIELPERVPPRFPFVQGLTSNGLSSLLGSLFNGFNTIG